VKKSKNIRNKNSSEIVTDEVLCHESPFLPPSVCEGKVVNIREDMESMHRGIVRMGKEILQKGGELTFESKSSRP
jgi:hypothetical protein